MPSPACVSISPVLEALNGFLREPPTESVRVFHGRGGCYPGLEWCVVDAFAPVLLVSLFDCPPPLLLAELTRRLEKLPFSDAYYKLAIQHRYLPDAPYDWVIGGASSDGQAARGNQRFLLRYTRQNVGFFLDMEPGRQWLEQRSSGARVLNLFSYTCAFSVVAQVAGAQGVVNVDMSKSALTVGRENHRLNGLPTDAIEFMPLDILKSWSRIRKRGPYDVIVVDPPSFQKGSFVARRDYGKVVRRLPELAAGNADILACLNAPELLPHFLIDCFATHAPDFRFVERLAAAEAFPDVDSARRLKLLHFSRAAQVDVEPYHT